MYRNLEGDMTMYHPPKPQRQRPAPAPALKPRDKMPPPLSNPHDYQTNGLKKNRNFTPI